MFGPGLEEPAGSAFAFVRGYVSHGPEYSQVNAMLTFKYQGVAVAISTIRTSDSPNNTIVTSGYPVCRPASGGSAEDVTSPERRTYCYSHVSGHTEGQLSTGLLLYTVQVGTDEPVAWMSSVIDSVE